MKKILLSITALCFASLMYSQITLIDEKFDTFQDFAITGFGNWQTLDLDGLNTYTGGTPTGTTPSWANAGAPMAFQIFNPTTAMVTNSTSGAEVTNFDPKSGAKYAACWDAVPGLGLTGNEDWLISPPLSMGGSGNSLSFWVKSLSNTYGLEQYKVGIYVGNGTPTSTGDFAIISGLGALSAPYPAWGQKTYNLDAYANQTIRVGIQCISEDVYMFMVDDFKVTATTLATNETNTKATYSIFPNPSNGVYSIRSSDKVVGLRVYDAAGKLVLENKNSTKVDISNQPTGVYFMNIAFGDGSIKTEKLIKE